MCSPGCVTAHPSQSWPLQLPITPANLQLLHRRWSPTLVLYQSHLLWAACFFGFFALFWSGAHLQLPKTPQCCRVVTSRLTAMIVLWHSMTSLWSWGVFVVGATGDTLCPVAAVLSYLSVRPNRQGSQFICIRMFAHCHRLIWWQQFVKPRLQMALMCHISMAIVSGLEPLPPWPRLVSQTPSFSFWVTGSPPHS